MSDETPTLEQVFATKIGGAANFLVELPARVVEYYEAEQAVDAEIVILEYVEQEGGGRKAVPRPVVIKAPVVFFRAGACGVTVPVSVGDVVMLHFQSANLSRWLAVGGISEPQDDRKHALCSAVAYPGGHSFVGSTAPKTTAPQDAVVVHAAAGKEVRLGAAAATQAAIRGTAYRAAEDALISAESTFLAALGVYGAALAELPGMTAAGTAFASALTAYNAARSTYSSSVAGSNSLSDVVKLV